MTNENGLGHSGKRCAHEGNPSDARLVPLLLRPVVPDPGIEASPPQPRPSSHPYARGESSGQGTINGCAPSQSL